MLSAYHNGNLHIPKLRDIMDNISTCSTYLDGVDADVAGLVGSDLILHQLGSVASESSDDLVDVGEHGQGLLVEGSVAGQIADSNASERLEESLVSGVSGEVPANKKFTIREC